MPEGPMDPDTTQVFEALLEGQRKDTYNLRLYVAGVTPLSLRAIANTKRFCEEYLPGRYTLQVVDVYQNPVLSIERQVVAAPTLVKETPAPVRHLVGDMSKTEAVLAGLDLPLQDRERH
jgi:circadian clock protein KaiB